MFYHSFLTNVRTEINLTYCHCRARECKLSADLVVHTLAAPYDNNHSLLPLLSLSLSLRDASIIVMLMVTHYEIALTILSIAMVLKHNLLLCVDTAGAAEEH